jgi:O-antigen ligase
MLEETKMAKKQSQVTWLVVLVVVGVLVAAVNLLGKKWLPGQEALVLMLSLGALGAAFCWAYFTDKVKRWWAIIPGLALFTLIAAVLVDVLTGTSTKNDWLNVLVLGAGAAIISWVLQRKDARLALAIVSVITLVVGAAMMPLTPVVKGVAIAVLVLVGGFILLRMRKA